MAYIGYHFFINGMELPYAPSELTLTVESKNQTVELVSGEEINILKNPALTEISFEIELPGGAQYPFANKYVAPEVYLNLFEQLMLKKTPAKLVITRPRRMTDHLGHIKKKNAFNTELTVSLEGYTVTESADNGIDLKVSLTFKEYIKYGTVKQVVTNKSNSSSTGNKTGTLVSTTSKPPNNSQTHTVKKGDCLWNIARKYYGNGSKYTTIYDANKTVIEDAAKKHGKRSSSNGHWIYPGTVLTIPALSSK